MMGSEQFQRDHIDNRTWIVQWISPITEWLCISDVSCVLIGHGEGSEYWIEQIDNQLTVTRLGYITKHIYQTENI